MTAPAPAPPPQLYRRARRYGTDRQGRRVLRWRVVPRCTCAEPQTNCELICLRCRGAVPIEGETPIQRGRDE